jgi:hypothetical protein
MLSARMDSTGPTCHARARLSTTRKGNLIQYGICNGAPRRHVRQLVAAIGTNTNGVWEYIHATRFVWVHDHVVSVRRCALKVECEASRCSSWKGTLDIDIWQTLQESNDRRHPSDSCPIAFGQKQRHGIIVQLYKPILRD